MRADHDSAAMGLSTRPGATPGYRSGTCGGGYSVRHAENDADMATTAMISKRVNIGPLKPTGVPALQTWLSSALALCE